MTDSQNGTVATAIDLYREEGLGELLAGVRREIERAVPLLPDPPHQINRVDIDDRWRMIEAHLSPADRTVLDTGCNAGLLTERAAATGRFAVGLELNADNLAYVDRDYPPGLGLMQYEVTAESAADLPDFDVVLALSVFHQWGRAYGWGDAEAILAGLGSGANRIFVEISPFKTPPAKLSYGGNGGGGEDYYRGWLASLFGDGTTVDCLGEVSTTAGAREERLMFVVSPGGGDGRGG